MNGKHESRQGQPVAFVTHTRDYTRAILLPALVRHGFMTVERAHDRETERLVSGFQPDLVVLVIDPRRSGDVDLVRTVRRNVTAPILVLAPGSQATGLGQALEAGADICAREADGPEVLWPQLAALARRSGTAVDPPSEATVVVRDLVLDFERCEATRAGSLLPLTPTEFKILALLAKSAGKVVGPVEILRVAQGFSYGERDAQQVVKVYIGRIRRKIELEPDAPTYILNVRGFGYMLERREPHSAESRGAAA